MQLLLPMVSHGPILFLTGAANTLGWAHWHMQQLLPMALFEPIIFLWCLADVLGRAHVFLKMCYQCAGMRWSHF